MPQPKPLIVIALKLHPTELACLEHIATDGRVENRPSRNAFIRSAIRQKLARADLPPALRTRLDSLEVMRELHPQTGATRLQKGGAK